MKICSKCGKEPRRSSRTTWCETCRKERDRENWAKKTEEERIANHLWRRYRLTYDTWLQMFQEQNYRCYLCSTTILPRFGNATDKGVVDHCHKTKQQRKLLCHHCNRALGLVKENKETLRNMINYIEDFS